MADSFTTNLRIRMPQTGAYNNTWGQRLNADMMALFDAAITGRSQITLSGSTYSMPAMTDGAASDSRAFCLNFIGAPSGTVTVTLPVSVVKKFYLIDNQSGQSVILTYSGSTDTVTVATGVRKLIWCDGTNVWVVFAEAADSDALGGIDSQYWARTGRTAAEVTAVTYLSNVFVNKVRNSAPWATVTEGVTTTIDCRDSNHQILTLTGNRTMAAPSNPLDGQAILLFVKQDGTGSRTLTWNAAFNFEQGTAPTLTTIAGRGDMFLMIYNLANTAWYVSHIGQDVGTGSGASYNLDIEENTVDWNLAARLGTLGGSVTVNVTVKQGVIIQATSSTTPALDLSGLPSGSTVNLLNLGYILGRGGRGAPANWMNNSDSSHAISGASSDGEDGGDAITGPGTGRTFNVTNANGRIWGGGGGGGAGGAATNAAAGERCIGGAGGGGAGGGLGGPGSGTTSGVSGTTGPSGAGGAAGSSATSGASPGNGGAGGDFGVDGTDGTASGGGSLATSAQTNGGTAGKAVELGGGAITWISGSGSPNVKGAVS